MKRGLLDLSSLIWTCLKGGEDTEHGKQAVDENGQLMFRTNGKRLLINSARYGYDGCVRNLIEVFADLKITPRQLIIVKEGMNSKLGRQALLETYKSGRDKLPGEYEQFNECRDMVCRTLLNLGAQMCWQDGGVEADDVLGYLAHHLDGETWIISGDKDLAQSVGGNVHHYRSGARDENPFGPFAHHLIPFWIAMVGDSTDKIPGAKGFGQGSAEKLLVNFGEHGLEAMAELIKNKDLSALVRDGEVKEMKELQKLVNDEKGVYLSYELGRLRIDKVNTMKKPIQWEVGMVKPRDECEEPAFLRYAGVNRLVCAENYDDSLNFFKTQIDRTPEFALDIETSTPPESDEWLAARDKEDAVDVFGSDLTGFSLTFGINCNLTFYVTVDHVPEEGVSNVTRQQAKDLIELIPEHKRNWVHNAAFELPVLFNSVGPLGNPDEDQVKWAKENVKEPATV